MRPKPRRLCKHSNCQRHIKCEFAEPKHSVSHGKLPPPYGQRRTPINNKRELFNDLVLKLGLRQFVDDFGAVMNDSPKLFAPGSRQVFIGLNFGQGFLG